MKKLLLLSIPFFITLIITEVALRFSPYRALLLRTQIQLEKNPDNQFFVADEQLGFRVRPQAVSPVRAFPHDGMSYTPISNEIGCYDRSIENVDISKAGLAIGDSFTFGTHEREFGWPSLVEKLSQDPILKCGVDSYGTKQELEWTRRILGSLKEKPKYILLQYFTGNDMFDDYLNPAIVAIDNQKVYRFDLSKTNFATGETFVRDEADLIKQLENEVAHQPSVLARHSIIVALIEGVLSPKGLSSVQIPTRTSSSHSPTFVTFDDKNRAWLKNAWDSHLEVIKNFKSLCDSFKIPLFVVIVPANDQVYPFLLTDNVKSMIDLTQPNRIVGDFLKKNNVSYLDLLEGLRRFADQKNRAFLNPDVDLYNKVDGHFSKTGEKITSLLVAKFLAENNVFSDSEKVRETVLNELKVLETDFAQGDRQMLFDLAPIVESFGPAEVRLSPDKDSSAHAFWVKLNEVKDTFLIDSTVGTFMPVMDLKNSVITFEIPEDNLTKLNHIEIRVYDRVLGLYSKPFVIPILR